MKNANMNLSQNRFATKILTRDKENNILGTVEYNENLRCDPFDPENCLGITRIKRNDVYAFVLIEYNTNEEFYRGRIISDEEAFNLISEHSPDLLGDYFPDGLPKGTELEELEEV